MLIQLGSDRALTSFLFLQLSVLIQRFNAVLLYMTALSSRKTDGHSSLFASPSGLALS